MIEAAKLTQAPAHVEDDMTMDVRADREMKAVLRAARRAEAAEAVALESQGPPPVEEPALDDLPALSAPAHA